MSSSQRVERVVHQDYIARIRYSNELPPPSNPPKLLDIPGTGLAGGDYTSASYAAKLARAQPVNIEADAELGMPIDLVGLPGVFDGDEKAIFARSNPYIHPADKALLKPLNSLGKANVTAGGVSFLRRTEYTAPTTSQHFASSTSKDLLKLRNDPKRKKQSMSKDDPLNILRNIIKGFDIAYPQDAYRGEDSGKSLRGAAITDAEARAWAKPVHPANPSLELLDSYPLLPDLDAIPAAGYFLITKFNTNPSSSHTSAYDHRLDSAILRPINDPLVQTIYEQKLNEWDPTSSRPKPLPEFDYDYYLPLEETSNPRNLKRKYDPGDPSHDDEELYTDDLPDDRRGFKYARLRTYETANQHGDPDRMYNDTVALALHDASDDVGVVPGIKKRLQKGAYFYPIIQRTALRPKRTLNGMVAQRADEEIDELNVTVVDPDEEDIAAQLEKRAQLKPVPTEAGETSMIE